MTTLTIAKAINEGLRKALEHDPKVLLIGEDIGKLGGVFRVTDGLQKDFGESRVIDSPLAEGGIVGTAVGLAMRGYRPVCEIQFDGFVFPAFDQIVSQVAKQRSKSQGAYEMGLVIRIPYAGQIGAIEHHSESPESLFAHTAGLRVWNPSNAHDAYWMIQEAIASPDPIIFCEPKCRYWEKGEVDQAGTTLRAEQAVVLRPGTDVTVVTYGPSVKTALRAAQAAEAEGVSLEVVDLRTVAPWDLPTVRASVERTGRCIVVSEAVGAASISTDIAARVTEHCFYTLQAPPLRVTSFHTPYPPSRIEEAYVPNLDRVMDAVDRVMAY
jgi:2-oxoisovalerate dehydrogenase E1 component beta subunit